MARKPAAAPAAPASPSPVAITVTGPQFAEILGIDERTLLKYVARGLIIRSERGRYLFLPSIKKLFTQIRTEAAGRSETGVDTVNAVLENALYKRAQRQKMELESDKEAGKLILVSDLEPILKDYILGVKAIVEAFPSIAQMEMPHLTPMDIQTIKRISRQLLDDAAAREIQATGSTQEIEALKRGEKPKADDEE